MSSEKVALHLNKDKCNFHNSFKRKCIKLTFDSSAGESLLELFSVLLLLLLLLHLLLRPYGRFGLISRNLVALLFLFLSALELLPLRTTSLGFASGETLSDGVGGVGVKGVDNRKEVNVASSCPIALLMAPIDDVVAPILRRQRQAARRAWRRRINSHSDPHGHITIYITIYGGSVSWKHFDLIQPKLTMDYGYMF